MSQQVDKLGMPDYVSSPPKNLKLRPHKEHPKTFLQNLRPTYSTNRGAAYLTDSLRALRELPDESVELVLTSPPYALHFKKEYGNVNKEEYVEWFIPFAIEIYRILKNDGSFVLNIGGSYNAGTPTRSLYQYKLLLELCDRVQFHLAQEFYWYNPAKLPSPAEWVNVRRIRVKDSVEHVWWLSKTPWPKSDNRNVLVEYSKDMKRLIKKGYRTKQRPSGHNITAKFQNDHGGAIPPNVIQRGNNESNSEYFRKLKEAGMKPHPARFPEALPSFFFRLLTDTNDLIVDPFAGSNTTGAAAEKTDRRWLSMEIDESYIKASQFRFENLVK